MNKPSRKAIIATVAGTAVLALGGTAAAIAHEFYEDHDDDRYGRYEHVFKELDDHIALTPEQRAEFERIFDERREETQALREARLASLQELIVADEVSPAEAAAVIDDLFERRLGRFDDEAAEVFVAIHGVLTPEQRAHIAEEIAEEGHRLFDRRGHGHGRRHRR